MEYIEPYVEDLLNIHSSRYKGVSYDRHRSKWVANVMYNKKKVIQKRCETEEEAIKLVIQAYKDIGKPLHLSLKTYLKANIN